MTLNWIDVLARSDGLSNAPALYHSGRVYDGSHALLSKKRSAFS